MKAVVLCLCVLTLVHSPCPQRQEPARRPGSDPAVPITAPPSTAARTPSPAPASLSGLGYRGDVLYFDDRPVHLWSGELPYYRIDPASWGERLDAARAAGIRFITAYVPWNLHEPEEGRFDFTGAEGEQRRNLVEFIELIAGRGMYFIPKPGPFICAEVRHGGIPDWLTTRHPEIAMRDQHGRVVRFRQDGTPLPDYLNPVYLAYVKRWYAALYEAVVAKYQFSRGPLVAIQVENELIYSTSELADPFSWGYTATVQELYRDWLRKIYRDIRRYNRAHGTLLADFSDVSPPKLQDWGFGNRSGWLSFQDWVRFKGWYGGAVLREYGAMLRSLGVTVPLYHNAGMLEDEAPMSFGSIAGQIWLGVNFWLSPHPLYSYASYVRGVRRLKQLAGSQPYRPSIASEVNWGWGNAEEFDFLTRYTLPYSKATNVYPLSDSSNAGTLAGRAYSTSPEPYPGDAPIDSRGNRRPAYRKLSRLIRYTDCEGEDFAAAAPVSAIGLGSYSEYNIPALYTRYGRAKSGPLGRAFSSTISANGFLQEMMEAFIERDVEFDIVDLQHSPADVLAGRKMLIVLSQEIMDAATQNALVEYVRGGGILVLMPTIPTLDLELTPASELKDSLLGELDIETDRPIRRSRQFRFDGGTQAVTATILSHTLKTTAASWQVVGRDDRGQIAAVEKTVGRGKLIYIGFYTTDPRLFLWLARREEITARYAYTDEPGVEIVPVRNSSRGVNYLFVVNRGLRTRSVDVHYLDGFNGGRFRTLRTSVGGHSVSILKTGPDGLRSASLCGGRGVFVRSDAGGLYLDEATEVDLLEEASGDFLFWADQPTEVRIELPAGEEDREIRVTSGCGRAIPVTVAEGSVRFAYRPDGAAAEYYRIIERKSRQ